MRHLVYVLIIKKFSPRLAAYTYALIFHKSVNLSKENYTGSGHNKKAWKKKAHVENGYFNVQLTLALLKEKTWSYKEETAGLDLCCNNFTDLKEPDNTQKTMAMTGCAVMTLHWQQQVAGLQTI